MSLSDKRKKSVILDRKIRHMVSVVPEPAILLDSGLSIIAVNGIFLKNYNVSRRKLVGRNFFDLDKFGWDTKTFLKYFDKVCSGKNTFASFTVRLPSRRGNKKKVISVHLRKIYRSEFGEQLFILSFSEVPDHDHPRSAYKKSRENSGHYRIEKKVQGQDNIVSDNYRREDLKMVIPMVTHELRKPLSVIGMALANIEKKNKDRCLDPHIEKIRKNLQRSERIIDSMLDYTSVRSPVKERFSISDLVAETWEDVFSQRKSEICKDMDIEQIREVYVLADPVQLRHVLENLLINAIEAIDEKGKVSLRAKILEGTYLVIEIVDTANAIPDELKEKIFDPFFTTKPNGNGLGLSICSQIVNMHEGSIELKSFPDQGNVFKVKLPVVVNSV